MDRGAAGERVFVVVDDVTEDGAGKDEQPAVGVYENDHCKEFSTGQWLAPGR